MPLFSFTQPQNQNPLSQQSIQQGMDQYQQQGQNLINPGQVQLQQSDPYAMAGRQSLGGAFHRAGQMGPPGSMQQPAIPQGVPMDASAYLQQKGVTPQALAQGLMAQPPQQNPWTITPDYPAPNFGGKQGAWG